MLGLIGWLIAGGSALKHVSDVSGYHDGNRQIAKDFNELTFRDWYGNLRLTKTNEIVFRRNELGHDCLVNKKGQIVHDFTKEKKEKEFAEKIAPIKAKAEELAIKDRDWMYVNQELEWWEEWQDARIDINTGEKFGVIAICDIKSKWTDDIDIHPWYDFEVCRRYIGSEKYTRKSIYKDAPPFICLKFDIRREKCYTYQDNESYRKWGDARTHRQSDGKDHSGDFEKDYHDIGFDLIGGEYANAVLEKKYVATPCFTEISLTDYIFKYKGYLPKETIDFLLQTGVIESSNVERITVKQLQINRDIDFYKPLYRYTTKMENITKVNEDVLAELKERMANSESLDGSGSGRHTHRIKVDMKY